MASSIHPAPPHWIIFQTVILQLLSAASHLLLSELARSQRATRQHHSTYLPLVLAHFRHVQTSFWSMFFFLFEVLSLNVESHSRWLLQFLLLTHFLPNKRGKWYIRICLDYDHHLNMSSIAIITAKRGLNDRYVKMGDRLELQKRLEKLKKK